MNSDEPKPLIIAHRGASEAAPENTLAAFEKALADGAEGVEFDVQLAHDRVPVVFHDADLRRVAGRDFLISEMSSRELQKIDVGAWFNRENPRRFEEKFAGETIPTLEQTLLFLKNYEGIIYIELKCDVGEEKALARAVCKTIENSELLPQIIVKSFNLDALPYVQKFCPQVKTAALFAPKVLILLRKEKRLINIARDLSVDFISIHFSLATRNLIEKAANENIKTAVWTADSPRWIKRGKRLGIDHLITNDPARLLSKRQKWFQKNSLLT